MEFTVTNGETLSGDETWSKDGLLLPRKPEQYLHFRLNVYNQTQAEQALWLVIPFPAIQHLTVSDGTTSWVTGDAMPFSTRPVASTDYIFPVRLHSAHTTRLSGTMQGEILRYSFILSTPEIISQTYRHSLIRDMSFFGAMGTLVVVCLIIYIATRYQPYLSFAVFTLSFGLWFFRVFGYAFEIIWPKYPQFNDISYALLLYSVMISSSWMIVSLLKRQDKTVKYQRVIFWYTVLLVVSGVLAALFLELNTVLRIPLFWFFPAILILCIMTYLEHKSGSIKAKWFAVSMLPLVFGATVVVMFGLGLNIPLDPVMTIMLSIVTTCLLLTVMISTYLIRLLQNQRDTKQQQALKLEILVKERTQELESTNLQLLELAANDPLTKLPNRRSLDLFVDDSAADKSNGLGIAMLDLDHFKQLNDTFGHDVGDMALCAVANLLKPFNTDLCIAARFGGEEFAIVQRQCDPTEFDRLLKSLHIQINKIKIAGYPQIELKTCIGWATANQQESVGEAFRRADMALYQAKRQGRNQVISATL